MVEAQDIVIGGISAYGGYMIGDVGLQSALEDMEWYMKKSSEERLKMVGLIYVALAILVYKFGPRVKIDGAIKTGVSGFLAGIGLAALRSE